MSRSNRPIEDSRPFEVSERPLVPRPRPRVQASGIDDANLDQLPRSYGHSMLFAIARDPDSLFVYWDIDWSNVFKKRTPHNRKVYVRAYDRHDREITSIEVEPLASNANVPVARPGNSVRVEIGYFDSERTWHSVAVAPSVMMPPDKMGPLSPGDFALVPFHVTFQRLTELFCGTRRSDETLTQALARLEESASDPQRRGSLTSAEEEVYRAMKASIVGREYHPRRPLAPADEKRLQKRLEQIIGVGATSPRHAFGGGSRSG
jgi:Domain of unknown function (DUF4912)